MNITLHIVYKQKQISNFHQILNITLLFFKKQNDIKEIICINQKNSKVQNEMSLPNRRTSHLSVTVFVGQEVSDESSFSQLL